MTEMARTASAEAPALGRPAGRDGKETRALILSVAAKAVAQHGIENLRLHAIAEEAGVTRAAIYHHFDSKEDLLLSVFAEGIDNFRRLSAAVTQAPTALDKVLAFIETSRQLQQDDYRYRLAFLGLVEYSRDPERFKAIRAGWDLSVALLRDAVAEIIGLKPPLKDRAERQAVDVTVSILIGGLTTLSFLREEPGDYGDAMDIIRKLIIGISNAPVDIRAVLRA